MVKDEEKREEVKETKVKEEKPNEKAKEVKPKKVKKKASSTVVRVFFISLIALVLLGGCLAFGIIFVFKWLSALFSTVFSQCQQGRFDSFHR